MTETTSVSNSHAHFGRLARTRLATRAAIVRRTAVAAAPAGAAGRRNVRQPVVAGRVPAAAGNAAPGGRPPFSPSPRWRRFIRCASSASRRRRDRPAHRTRQPARAQSGFGPVGPAERPPRRLRRRAVARAPAADGRAAGRRLRRPAAHARSRTRSVGAARRGGAAVRRRLRLFVRPAGRQRRRCVSPASGDRRHSAAHRCLGDAAGLYRQGADLPHLRRQSGRRPSSPSRRAATSRCA